MIVYRLTLRLQTLHDSSTLFSELFGELDDIKPFLTDQPLAFFNHRVRDYNCCGSPVSHTVIGFVGGLLQKFRAQVFILVLKLDFLRYCHAIKGNLRRAVALFNNHRPTARTQSDAYRSGKFVYPAFQRFAGFFIK